MLYIDRDSYVVLHNVHVFAIVQIGGAKNKFFFFNLCWSVASVIELQKETFLHIYITYIRAQHTHMYLLYEY